MSGSRLRRVLLALLVASGAYACSDLLVTPAVVGDHRISVSLAGSNSSAGPGAAFDRADRLRIRVRQGDRMAKDTLLTFAAAGEATRVQLLLERSLAREAVAVDVELLKGDAPLFRGTTTVTLLEAGNTVAPVPLSAVVARLSVPDSIGPLESLGASLPLTGAALFATGDTVTTVPLLWRVIDPGIVTIANTGGMAVAVAEGRARLEVSAGSVADTVTAVVHAVVARVDVAPATLALEVGASQALAAIPRDANGNALGGRPAVWSSSDASVAAVDPTSGVVGGVTAGSAVVSAAIEGRSGASQLSVLNPAPVLLELQPGGAVAGAAATTLVLRGRGFTTQSRVRWSGELRTTQYVGPTELRVALTAADLAAAGAFNVSVESPAPGGGGSLALPFVVTRPPSIDLSLAAVAFTAKSGGAEPDARTVGVANGGDGALSGLGASVQYTSGQPTGWLSAALVAPVAPTTLVLRASPANLPPGSYSASVSVASAVASNSPRRVSVTFVVEPDPKIALSAGSLLFGAPNSGANPDSQVVNVSNAGTGTLSGLSRTITYGAGQPTGWLSTSLNTTTAPARLVVRPTSTLLAVGTYTATVEVRSPVASNSPRSVTVTYNVTAAPVSFWRAEGNYLDSGNAGNHGTPVGPVTFDPGFIGQAFQFDGPSAPAQIDAPEGGGLATATRITLATWVNLDTLEAGTGVRRFISVRPERAVLRLDGQFGGASGAGPNSLHFYVSTSGGSFGVYADGVLEARGCWMHVAGTFDGATSRLYLDGEQVASQSVTGTLTPGSGAGIKLSNQDGGGLETLHGLLDDVRVYGRAASASEIAGWAAEAGAGPKCADL